MFIIPEVAAARFLAFVLSAAATASRASAMGLRPLSTMQACMHTKSDDCEPCNATTLQAARAMYGFKDDLTEAYTSS